MSALPVEFDPASAQAMPILPVPVVPVLVPLEPDTAEPAATAAHAVAQGTPVAGVQVPGVSVPDAITPDAPAAAVTALDAATPGTPAQAAPQQWIAGASRHGLRARPVGRRSRPAGVRSCTAVSLAEAPPVPRLSLQAPSRVAQASPRLRLTARGRAAVATCAVVVATLLWFAVATAAHASAHGAPAAPAQQALTQVVVQPGQTLWSIATQADPSADPRLVVQRIVTANKLTSESVAAGQRLWVPRG